VVSMINAAHVLLYSPDADADRAFLRDVLGWPSLPAGGPDDDWLIFRLPPAELAVHPSDGPGSVALYLMCDDLVATLAELADKAAGPASQPQDRGWGVVSELPLPSGMVVGLYQPKHATAHGL